MKTTRLCGATMDQVKASGVTDWRAHGLSRPPITELLAMQSRSSKRAPPPAARRMSCIARSGAATISPAPIAAGRFRATVECCIHYLTLDEENDVKRLGGKAKINPPIRPRAEVETLWRQVAEGTCLAGLDRSRQLVGKPQDQSGYARQRIRRPGARGDGAALRQGPAANAAFR
jgi:dihydroorotase-like cyclic amidohydrolase